MPTFNTRIQNKIDTYQNWFTNNPTPLKGEICIVTVPADTNAVVQEPAILIKVGNGTDDFKTLPFISGKAADVSSWALADTKPTYTAAEIEGLSDFISGEIQDTNTEYSFFLTDNYKLHMLWQHGEILHAPGFVFIVICLGVGKSYQMTESPCYYIFIADNAAVSVFFAAQNPRNVTRDRWLFRQNKSFCQNIRSVP